MAREWMALLGAVIFVVTIGTGGYIMASVMDANAARQRRKREEESSAPTPPPARH